MSEDISEAKAFWQSDDAGDTVNYPWEAAEIYANTKCDVILAAIAERRNYHLNQAQEQLSLVVKYASRTDPESAKSLSDASGAANWHNFAANSLMVLLREADRCDLKPGANATFGLNALAAARLAGKLEGLEMAREIAEPHHQIVAWTITARIAEIEKGARDDDAK